MISLLAHFVFGYVLGKFIMKKLFPETYSMMSADKNLIKLLELLPKGSAFGDEWRIIQYGKLFVCRNFYQIMEDNGFCAGLVPFQAYIYQDENGKFYLPDVRIDLKSLEAVNKAYAKISNTSARFNETDLAEHIFNFVDKSIEKF